MLRRRDIFLGQGGSLTKEELLHLLHNGFLILATRGTAEAIARMGVPVKTINKIGEGSPHVVDWIERGDVNLIVNTPTGSGARSDGWEIRRSAIAHVGRAGAEFMGKSLQQ